MVIHTEEERFSWQGPMHVFPYLIPFLSKIWKRKSIVIQLCPVANEAQDSIRPKNIRNNEEKYPTIMSRNSFQSCIIIRCMIFSLFGVERLHYVIFAYHKIRNKHMEMKL